jgi:hypothetical protein
VALFLARNPLSGTVGDCALSRCGLKLVHYKAAPSQRTLLAISQLFVANLFARCSVSSGSLVYLDQEHWVYYHQQWSAARLFNDLYYSKCAVTTV